MIQFRFHPVAHACALAVSALAAEAGAQTKSPPAAVQPATQVVVAAVQPTTQVVVAGVKYDARRDDTASTFVVTQADLLRDGDRTLADALKRVPGISVGRGGDIRMRGLGNGYTQILLNGVATPASFALESISPELIERVEIINGASVVTGTQGIAGTVNVILKASAPSARTEWKAGVDRQNDRLSPSVSVTSSDKRGGHSYTLAATLSRTSTAIEALDEERGADAADQVQLARLRSSESYNLVNLLRLSARTSHALDGGDSFSSQTFIDVNDRAIDFSSHETTQVGSPSTYPNLTTDFYSKALFARGDLNWVRRFDGGARVEAKAGANYSRRSSDYSIGPTNGAPVRNDQTGIVEDGLSFSGKYSLAPLGQHVLVFGWDTGYNERRQTRYDRDVDSNGAQLAMRDGRYDGSVRRWALFGQDEWEIDPRWSASAGLRWEAMATAVSAPGTADVAQSSGVPSPVLQVLFKQTAERQWRAGLSRTYKAPSMFNLIPRRFNVVNNNSANNPDTQGNPMLRPEVAWGIDVGYTHFLGKGALLSASAFVRRIDDVTVQQLFQDGAAWVLTPANLGRARVHGFALEAKLPLNRLVGAAPAMELRASLARNWSRVESVPGPDNRLDSQVPVTASVGLDHRTAGGTAFGASFNYQGGGAARQSARAMLYSAPTRELDVYGLWTLASKTRLRVSGANLLRQDRVTAQRYQDGAGSRATTATTASYMTLRLNLEYDLGR